MTTQQSERLMKNGKELQLQLSFFYLLREFEDKRLCHEDGASCSMLVDGHLCQRQM